MCLSFSKCFYNVLVTFFGEKNPHNPIHLILLHACKFTAMLFDYVVCVCVCVRFFILKKPQRVNCIALNGYLLVLICQRMVCLVYPIMCATFFKFLRS